MKVLENILINITPIKIIGSVLCEINSLVFDSRKIEQDDVFFAISGTLSDGHDFIDLAISKGAIVVVCENLPSQIKKQITYILVSDSKKAMGKMASNYFECPSKKLKLIGVTGTNGKTTIVTLLFELFRKLGYKAGLISTIKNSINDSDIPATHTTPDVISLNQMLNNMVEQGCDYCFMEVSSHAIDQKRIANIYFAGGIFTNITHDHLDYHKTFDNYIKTKKKFFDDLPSEAFALINIDDKNGKVMIQNTLARKYEYGLNNFAHYMVRIIEHHFDGMLLSIKNNEVWTKFIGEFNASNLLAVYAVANLFDQNNLDVLTKMSELESVSGRFQYFKSNNNITAIVDYAHTPDALKNVLLAVNKIRIDEQKIITVIGAGGNRDKTKRPEMGKIASTLSDKVIFTSDNPRNEDPEQIILEMEMGVRTESKNKVISITNRKQAIVTALHLAQENDIVLVAGKGHETYQEIKGVRYDFDDREIIKDILNKIN